MHLVIDVYLSKLVKLISFNFFLYLRIKTKHFDA